MTFWQLTVDCKDPARLTAFWGFALGYVPTPPAQPASTWLEHYRARLGAETAFDNRLFDPEGLRPPIWFQQVPEEKAGKNRLHLDLYPTGRDNSLSQEQRIALVDAMVVELVDRGATVLHTERNDDPADLEYFTVLQDPEGSEFCVS